MKFVYGFYSFCAGIGGQSAVVSGSGDIADGVRIRSVAGSHESASVADRYVRGSLVQ